MQNNQRDELSQRLRALREAVGEDVAITAKATGITTELYEKYESGESDIPISFLSAIATHFGVNVNALLTGSDARARVFSVTRAGRGPVVERRAQYHYEALAAGFAGKPMEPYRVTVEPGRADIVLNTHSGQEPNVALSGTLLVRVDGHDTILNKGDAIYYDSSRPHGMQALNDKPAVFIAVITS